MIWTIAISTSIITDQPLVEALPMIRQAGFRRLEIGASRSQINYHDRGMVSRLRAEADRWGLAIDSLHAPFGGTVDLTLPDEPGRQAAVAEVKAAADTLLALGGNTLVLHAGSEDMGAHKDIPVRLEQSLRSVTEVNAYCRQAGITLAIEDMLGHLVGGLTHQLQWLLGHFADRELLVCLDTGHSFLSGHFLDRVRMLGPLIHQVHAHDNNGVHDDHLPPGEGKVPWARFVDTMAEFKFQGNVALEILSGTETAAALKRTVQSVEYLKRLAEVKGHQVLTE